MSKSTMIRAGEHQGFPALLIETPFSTAVLSLYGGQLLSFVPTGFDDLLWLSPESKRPPAPIRGGIPVCWPYFARQGQPDDVPQHGPVRTLAWRLIEERREDDAITLQLAPPALPDSPLSLSMTLRIGRALEQTLTTRNEGADALAFTQALHTYFKVADALQVHATGLDGCDYLDKNDGMRRHTQRGDWDLQDPRDPGRSDRIYLDTGHSFALIDPAARRCVSIETAGSRTLVAWNPGADGQRSFSDLPTDGWRQFVCLEAANAGEDVIELAPGGAHALQQTISVTAHPMMQTRKPGQRSFSTSA